MASSSPGLRFILVSYLTCSANDNNGGASSRSSSIAILEPIILTDAAVLGTVSRDGGDTDLFRSLELDLKICA